MAGKSAQALQPTRAARMHSRTPPHTATAAKLAQDGRAVARARFPHTRRLAEASAPSSEPTLCRHTFAASLATHRLPLSLPSMVRIYQKKGGHGGARNGAGNNRALGGQRRPRPAQAAAIAKVEAARRKGKGCEAEAMKRKAQDRWRLWAASSSTQQSSSEQQQSAKPKPAAKEAAT